MKNTIYGEPNVLYTNKNGKVSGWKLFWGWKLTFLWDWILIFLTNAIPIAVVLMLAITHNHLEIVIAWVLIAFWIITMIADIFLCYYVEEYIPKEKVDAKEPDRKGMFYALFSLNIGVFVLIYQKLSKAERRFITAPTEIFKHKHKPAKSHSKTASASKKDNK